MPEIAWKQIIWRKLEFPGWKYLLVALIKLKISNNFHSEILNLYGGEETTFNVVRHCPIVIRTNNKGLNPKSLLIWGVSSFQDKCQNYGSSMEAKSTPTKHNALGMKDSFPSSPPTQLPIPYPHTRAPPFNYDPNCWKTKETLTGMPTYTKQPIEEGPYTLRC